MIERVAVIGGGTMGNGIAQVFAMHGASVQLVDVDDAAIARAKGAIDGSLGRLVKKEKMTADEASAVLSRIDGTTDFAATADRQLVVEAVPERLEVKKAVFEKLDRITGKDCILASNTSSISITKIAATTKRADRVIGMHFMNPVPIMKLVEVIRGNDTSDATADFVVKGSEALGKIPVVAQDYPGFVSNRVLMPMINEAIFCLMEGVATREAIDEIMKLGMAHPMGPLTLADFIGLDVCLEILDVLKTGIGDDKYRACPLLRRMVAAGHLGRKTGRGFYEY
ncbi:MAG: 3-hydroxybutyryl-CoA dehydrogenase [Planctomycetes bacterium]|nr:3-hydroxybutyryl-CoA dehydrogenase [Planctomycetota bacterium]MCB9917242.1 3-hydroxybutyryl-CoA dehydrogenase [Planctomycetota bacterium]